MPEITHPCAQCVMGFPEMCENPTVIEQEVPIPDTREFWIIPCIEKFRETPQTLAAALRGEAGRPALQPGQITDATSTGRKRAAQIMPFFEGQVCGWAGLKHAGGGVVPILGCQGNTIADVKTTEAAHEAGADEVGHRHHGPDKNVLNNTPGMNLHGVCSVCHTRWHAVNDRYYSPEGRPGPAFPFTPVEPYYGHDPLTTFTEEELAIADAWWSLPKAERPEFPFKPAEGTKMLLPFEAGDATLNENPFPDSPFEIGDFE